MGEGLIGLIIMLIIIQLGSRLLRALSAKQPPEPGRPSPFPPSPAAPKPRPPSGIRPAGEAPESGQLHYREAAEQPKTGLHSETGTPGVPGHEGAGTTGPFARWNEDRFEESSDAISYLRELMMRPTRVQKQFLPEAQQSTAAPEVENEAATITVSDRERIGLYAPGRKKRTSERIPTSLHGDLGDTRSLRRAIVLSTILGPCIARKRRRV